MDLGRKWGSVGGRPVQTEGRKRGDRSEKAPHRAGVNGGGGHIIAWNAPGERSKGSKLRASGENVGCPSRVSRGTGCVRGNSTDTMTGAGNL